MHHRAHSWNPDRGELVVDRSMADVRAALETGAWLAAGKPIPDVDLLPVGEMDFGEIRERQEAIDEIATLLAKQLAARGRRTSDAKRRAARANGRKGGRPRKQA